MLHEENRAFEVSYYDSSLREGTYDVTFTLGPDAENALFEALGREVAEPVREGVVPDQKMHLYRRLAKQRSEHPPWIEASGDERTYDIELTEWDYHLLTSMIGESLSNVLGPDGADRYSELVDAWQEITTQMQVENEVDELEDELEQMSIDTYGTDPDNGSFVCLLYGGTVRKYTNDDGDTWYVCTGCDTNYAEISDDHECLNDGW